MKVILDVDLAILNVIQLRTGVTDCIGALAVHRLQDMATDNGQVGGK